MKQYKLLRNLCVSSLFTLSLSSFSPQTCTSNIYFRW